MNTKFNFKKIAAVFIGLLFCVSSFAGKCKDTMAFTEDKALHFTASFGMALLGSAIAGNYKAGFLGSVAIGTVKEGMDSYSTTGCASWNDMAYNVAGAAAGALVAKATGFEKAFEPQAKHVAERLQPTAPNAIAAMYDYKDQTIDRTVTHESGVYLFDRAGLVSYQDGNSNWGLKVNAKRVRLVFSTELSL